MGRARMNVQATLDKCRIEYERQMVMEKAATPGPVEECVAREVDNTGGLDWAIADSRHRIIAECFEHVGEGPEKRPAEANVKNFCLSRNLNPARLRVAKIHFTTAYDWVQNGWPNKLDIERETNFAAVLLGVEAVE